MKLNYVLIILLLASVSLSVMNVSLHAAGFIAPAQSQPQPVFSNWDAWHGYMSRIPTPAAGCFRAGYPNPVWQSTTCAPPIIGHETRSLATLSPVGNTNDFVAQSSSTLIGSAIGTFTSVTGLTSETDVCVGPPPFCTSGGAGPNAYSLQINAVEGFPVIFNGWTGTGWQQFVFVNDPSGSQGLLIEYWLLNYLATHASCPGSVSQNPADGGPWFSSGTNCVWNTATTTTLYESATSLSLLSFEASVNFSPNSLDETQLCVMGGTCYAKSEPASVLNLYQQWRLAEFNVFGLINGSQAQFNFGTTITVKNALTDQSGNAISPVSPCPNNGQTGETNNLNLEGCAVNGNAIVFSESSSPADWPMLHHDLLHTGVTSEVVTPPLNLVWKYSTGGDVESSPAVSGGIVYVGSTDYYVYAMDAATGVLVWKYETGNAVISSPAVSGGIVYIGSKDGIVYALNATTGAKVWKYQTGYCVESSPAVSGGIVYIGSCDWNLYALNATTGAKVWSYPTGNYADSSPAVSGGILYFPSGNTVYALNAATGTSIWNYTADSWVSSPPTVSGGLVYVEGGYDDKVIALNAATGAVVWKSPIASWVDSSPAVSGGIVYVGSALAPNVYALNAATGVQVWNYSTGSWVESSPAVSGGLLYVGSDDDNLYALSAANGAQVWKYHTGSDVISSPAVSGGIVYVGSYDENVYAFAPVQVFQSLITEVDAGSGSVSLNCPGGCSEGVGSLVTVTATPSPGWQFSSWSTQSRVSCSTNPCAFTMPNNAVTLGVTFTQIPLVTMTLSYSVKGGGSPAAPTFNYVQSGQSKSYALKTKATGISVDSGSSWSVTPNPLSGSDPSEQWASNQALSGTASATTLVFTFYHQYLQTLSYSLAGAGSPTAPTFTTPQFGVSAPQTLTTSATGYWFDSGSSWSVTNPLKGSTSSMRWWASQTVKGKISSAQTINFVYQQQYLLTMTPTPSGGGTLSPVTGWQNAGASINIQATANMNYTFLSWAGKGTGNYAGTSNPTTVTMNGPITETANFQQTGGQLSVSLVSPKNGATVTSSPVTFSVKVAGFVQGTTVTVYVDGSQACSGTTSSTGAFSCKSSVTKTGGSHSWYATAAKTGFTSGTSPTWTFTY